MLHFQQHLQLSQKGSFIGDVYFCLFYSLLRVIYIENYLMTVSPYVHHSCVIVGIYTGLFHMMLPGTTV